MKIVACVLAIFAVGACVMSVAISQPSAAVFIPTLVAALAAVVSIIHYGVL